MKKKNLLSLAAILILLLFFSGCGKQNLPAGNIVTFARLYGYVKYFYPGDGAAKMDWDRFAVYGVKQVEKARNSQELKQKLEEIFLPMAPGIVIHLSGDKTDFSKSSVTPANTAGKKVVSWQHEGVSFGLGKSIYQSIRLHRKNKIAANQSGFGTITSGIPAQVYRGKEIRLKAAVKTEVESGEGQGQLWLRVDKKEGGQGFFNNMADRPVIAKEWQYYEISGKVDEDAGNIVFGCFLLGAGKVWVDDFQIHTKEGNTWKPVVIDNPGFEEDEPGSSPGKWGGGGGGYSFKVTAETAFQGKQSLIITKESLAAPNVLFEKRAQFGEYISKKIGSGLSCIVPLALYGTEETTYPQVVQEDYNALTTAVKEAAPGKLSGDDLYVRLADIVIAWNVFQHFFPYFDVVKTDWQASLTRALASAYQDKDKKDFLKTLRKFTAGLEDGHVRVYMIGDTSEFSVPAFNWDWVENNLVITDIFAESAIGLQSGDIVLRVDGEAAGRALEKEEELTSGATPGYRRYQALASLLRGAKGSHLALKIKRGSQLLEKNIVRDMKIMDYYRHVREGREKSKKIKAGIYYLNIDRITMPEIEKMLPELRRAKSIICDLRGYPNYNIKLLTYLLKEDDTSTKWMLIPRIIYPDYEKVTYKELGWQLKAAKPGLEAKIIFIIDSRAISAAESFMSFIEHYRLATIIGQPTAGTNGNVNLIPLPGGYTVSWTGMKVVKHDGSRHHGVGIIPDIFLARTIKGVKEGRDEFLEKTIELADK